LNITWFLLVPKLRLGNLYFSSSSLPWLGKQSFKDRVPKLELGNEYNSQQMVGKQKDACPPYKPAFRQIKFQKIRGNKYE